MRYFMDKETKKVKKEVIVDYPAPEQTDLFHEDLVDSKPMVPAKPPHGVVVAPKEPTRIEMSNGTIVEHF